MLTLRAALSHIALLQYLSCRKVAASPFRQLSAETRSLIDSRLIFVYDDEGCRELEGLRHVEGLIKQPMHRSLALSELERRIDEEFKIKQLTGSAAESEDKWIEALPARLPIRTMYLEALEMEIAHVPEFMTLADLERISESLPCVKYVARDDVKFAESEDQLHDVGAEDIKLYSERSPGPPSRTMPSDTLYKYQWGLHKDNATTYGINAEDVWTQHNWSGSEDMIIAIIDSGCNLNHPDMQGQFWRNPGEKNCNDGIDDDGNGFVDDCHGWDFVEEDNMPQAEGSSHGTAAAGIIAAASNNQEGIAGICANCRLMCLRFISNTEGTVANEVRAIDYAVRMGAKISNNSYGGYNHDGKGSRVEREAIERADRKGHLFVSSAGNNNMKTDNSGLIHTPSGYTVKNVLSVGASTEDGRKTSFSNFGSETVHMYAPGRNVISTGRDGYLVNQGTSFAAPHVAGAAGLVWSKFPHFSSDQIVDILMKSCRVSPELQSLARCKGVINALKAFELASKINDSDKKIRTGGAMKVSTTAAPVTVPSEPTALPMVVAFPPAPIDTFATDDEMEARSDGLADNIETSSLTPWDHVHGLYSYDLVAAPGADIHRLPALSVYNDTFYGDRHSVRHHTPHLQSRPKSSSTAAPTTTTTTTTSPVQIVSASSGSPLLLPADDSIWAGSTGDYLSTGIRSSTLGLPVALIPNARKIWRAPLTSAVDILNTGLEWTPSLSVVATSLSPNNVRARIQPFQAALLESALAHYPSPLGVYEHPLPHRVILVPANDVIGAQQVQVGAVGPTFGVEGGQSGPFLTPGSLDMSSARWPDQYVEGPMLRGANYGPTTATNYRNAGAIGSGLLNDIGEMMIDFLDSSFLSGFSEQSAGGLFERLAASLE